jgi:hypothetical protein
MIPFRRTGRARARLRRARLRRARLRPTFLRPTRATALLLPAALAVAGLLATEAPAATFSPTGATASSQFSGAYDPGNTIDGSGLGGLGFAPSAIHAAYSANNHWTTTGAAPLDQWIRWSFAAPVDIGGLWIWNHLSNNIASNPNYGPTLFSLTFLDASDAVLASFANIALSPQPVGGTTGASQGFTLGSVLSGVSALRFDVDGKLPAGNGTGEFTGLAEVLISDTTISGAQPLAAVPLPASGLLLLAALAGITTRRRPG